ncbi:MAG: hypothetical protein AAF219_04975 [Myxococcota bacterium]
MAGQFSFRYSRKAETLIVILASLTLLVFTFSRHRVAGNANVLSRLITVERLLDAGTFSHDGTPFPRSIDAVMIDGKIYSSKSPTYSMALAALAWPAHAITGASVYEHQQAYLWWLILAHQAAPYLFMLWFASVWIRSRSSHAWTRSVFMIALSLGCLPYGYAVTLNNHTPTAVLVFFMWVLTLRLLESTPNRDSLLAFGIGILGGLAVSYELTSGIFTPSFALVLMTKKRRYGVLLVLGAVVATLPMFIGYWAMSGSIVPFYLRPELYDYPGSFWLDPQGTDALTEPKWLYAFNALLGHHGLFSLSPFLALGVVGLAWRIRDGDWLSLAMLAGACIVVFYILSTTHNYGGRTLGMRWFAQFAPLLVVGALPVLEWFRERPRLRPALYGLLAISSIVVIEALIHSAFTPGGWVYGVSQLL